MKKFILGASAFLSLMYQAIAQTPTAPNATPVVVPAPVPTPPPVPPVTPSQPNNQKEKGEKHKGDHDANKGGERKEDRNWGNHNRKDKGKEKRGERKEERGERKEERGERKEERGERKEERGERKEERGERKGAHGVRKEARNEQKMERKEARGEKLDRMRAYLNLTPAQESRVSAAIQSFRAGAKATKADTRLTPEQKKAQLEKLAAERNAQLKAILTPEQLAKLAEAQKQGLGKGRNGFISDEWGDDD